MFKTIDLVYHLSTTWSRPAKKSRTRFECTSICKFARCSGKAFVQPAQFRLLSGKDKAKGYRKHAQTSMKYFCPECGVRTHELGNADYMGGDFVGIFLSSLDNAEPQELIAAPVRYSDGRNNNWQNPPAETRHL